MKLRQMCKAFVLALLGAMIISSAVMAGNSSFAFNLTNTGKTFNVDKNSGNTKATAGLSYVVNVKSISIQDSTASWGIAFSPMKKTLLSYSQAAPTVWKSSTGKFTGSWNSDEGKANKTYYLGARMDDVLSKNATTSGLWNADSQ